MRNRLFKLLLAVFAGMAVYYQARAADKDPAEIKWGYVTSTAYYWDVFAAMDKGFMRRQGLTVSPTKIDAASQSIQFVLTGAVDIVSTIPDLVINAIDKGGSLVIIGNEVTKVPWALMARPEIKTFADLKGKTIGVSAINDASTFLLRLLLQKQGLKPGDYQTIQLGGTPNRYAALHKGAVQATLLAQPADFKAESEGMRRLGSVDQAFEGPAIVYVARKDWVKANGDKVVRFLRGAMQGAQWLYDPKNKTEAINLLVKTIKASEADSAKTYEAYIERDKVIAVDAELPLNHIENYLKVRNDPEQKNMDPNQYVDLRYQAKAKQEGIH